MKRTVLSCAAAVSAIAATVLFFYSFPKWIVPLYFLGIALYSFSAGVVAYLFSAKRPVVKGLVTFAAYAGGFMLITFLVNNVMFIGKQATKATVIVSCVNAAFFIVFYVLMSRGKKRKRVLAAVAFILSLIPVLTYGAVIFAPSAGQARSVVGSTDAQPITATERASRFDRDRLLLGAYCFPKDGNYYTLRDRFKEAGLDFYVGAWGEELSDEDLAWLTDNGMGVFAPNGEYYRAHDCPAIWGIDLRDEPGSADFADLATAVDELYAEAPDRFPLINLFPMYANGDQLGEKAENPLAKGDTRSDALNKSSIQYRMHLSDYIGTIDTDIISVDIYPLEVDNSTGRLTTYGHWLRNLDILADACRATGRDLWVITQAAGNCVDENGGKRYCDTAEDQRWQDYVTLAFGAKAIIYACWYTGWWDAASHMVDAEGNLTDTYYAVKQVNEELAVFAREYGRYENHGAVLYNAKDSDAAGAGLPLLTVDEEFEPKIDTASPLLCGCFTEKDGDDKAYVFVNMNEPQTGKDAPFRASFPGATSITVYRRGKATELSGDSLELTLDSREGVFMTVKCGD